MSTDDEIIARSAEEPAEFGMLFDRHARVVYRYVAQRLGDHAADDLVAETFLVAFERRAGFDPAVGGVRSWLLGIATRLMRKHARVEAHARKGLSADLAAQIAPDFIEQAGSRLDAERLTARLAVALRRLSDADRDTLLLYAWADLDYAAIAAALQIPIGTVRFRLNRARRHLRRAAGIPSLEQETEYGRIDAASQHS